MEAPLFPNQLRKILCAAKADVGRRAEKGQFQGQLLGSGFRGIRENFVSYTGIIQG